MVAGCSNRPIAMISAAVAQNHQTVLSPSRLTRSGREKADSRRWPIFRLQTSDPFPIPICFSHRAARVIAPAASFVVLSQSHLNFLLLKPWHGVRWRFACVLALCAPLAYKLSSFVFARESEEEGHDAKVYVSGSFPAVWETGETGETSSKRNDILPKSSINSVSSAEGNVGLATLPHLFDNFWKHIFSSGASCSRIEATLQSQNNLTFRHLSFCIIIYISSFCNKPLTKEVFFH